MATYPLKEAKTVTLDGTGAGTVTFQVPPGKTWAVERINVSVAGGTAPGVAQSIAKVYRGEAGDDSRMTDGTYSGNLDTAEYGSPMRFYAGEFLSIRWTGGPSGVIAAARVEGTFTDGVL